MYSRDSEDEVSRDSGESEDDWDTNREKSRDSWESEDEGNRDGGGAENDWDTEDEKSRDSGESKDDWGSEDEEDSEEGIQRLECPEHGKDWAMCSEEAESVGIWHDDVWPTDPVIITIV